MPAALCHAPGCATPRARGQFMCRDHWFKVPGQLRHRINQTWRAWRNRTNGQDGSALWLDYIEATDDARRCVAEQEGQLDAFQPDLPRLKALHEARDARAED